MSSNKRSHKQNVDNLEVLTTQVGTFQPGFDPSETRLSIPNQVQLKSAGDQALIDVMAAESASNNAISARTASFSGFDSLITRVINALRISDVTDQTIEQAETIVRELRNKRALEIVPADETAIGTEQEPSAKQNKMRSGSMNTRIENFTKLLVFLSTIPAYKPNEIDVTLESLGVRLESLKLANSACLTTDAAVDAARLQRDIVLYADKTGLVDIALDSKLYVKSAYGASSPQYKAISGILFSRL